MFKKLVAVAFTLALHSCGVAPAYAEDTSGRDAEYCSAVVAHLTSMPMEAMLSALDVRPGDDPVIRVANTMYIYTCKVDGNLVLVKGDFEKGFYRAFLVQEDEYNYYISREEML
ncbi:hypothetical protein Y35_GM000162 [Pseudomonas phage YS35]|uniref:Uncharacterized protein n=1 Tax=Pseudomonas phage YS35 TaxID=2036050 RepID=A0A291LAZ7_9CAUD|nr:hypothetical protein QE343_gp095 [Pseudomonas phage YS35]ATI16135.1 hypothetical protein Y35_GM000162 [Pseudomonas phage YS35]WQZ01208.1 hypothetical protein [Pseudomonas phage Pae01]